MRGLLLLVLFAALYLPGLGRVGLIDYDEGAYAEVAREMLLAKELLHPSLNGEPFFEKPPLLYWTQVLGYQLVGCNPLGARLLNACAALAAVLALYGFACRPLGRRWALAAALILGSSLQFLVLARVALTDMMLTLWFVLCLGCLHRSLESRASSGRSVGWFLLASFCAGLAMLTKGAIGLVLPVLTVVAVSLRQRGLLRAWSRLHYLLGLPVMILTGTSWYLLLGVSQPGGFQFMRELFWEHHVGRFLQPMQGHSGSLLYYVPVLLLGFLPWSFLLPAGVAQVFKEKPQGERQRFLRLLGSFSLLTFVFFSVAATKLPNYITPALPGLAVFSARLFCCDAWPQNGWARAGAWASTGLLAVLAAVLLAMPYAGQQLPTWIRGKAGQFPGLHIPLELPRWALLSGAVLLLAFWLLVRAIRQRRPLHVGLSLGAGVSLSVALVIHLVLPPLDRHFLLPLQQLSVQAKEHTAADDRLILLGLRRRPSVTFYGDRYTEFCRSSHPDRLTEMLNVSTSGVGISSAQDFERYRVSHQLRLIDQHTGYVLFQQERRGKK